MLSAWSKCQILSLKVNIIGKTIILQFQRLSRNLNFHIQLKHTVKFERWHGGADADWHLKFTLTLWLAHSSFHCILRKMAQLQKLPRKLRWILKMEIWQQCHGMCLVPKTDIFNYTTRFVTSYSRLNDFNGISCANFFVDCIVNVSIKGYHPVDNRYPREYCVLVL